MKRQIIWPLIFAVLVGYAAAASGVAHAADERRRDFIHTYRVWKLTEILELSDEQMPVFFSKIRQVDEMEMELLEDERKAVREIAELLNDEKMDEARMEEALARYGAVRRQRLEDVDRLRADAMAMLSVRQRAQYVVFDQRFRSELRGMIEKARDLERQRRMDDRLDRRGEGFGPPGGRGTGGGGESGRGRP